MQNRDFFALGYADRYAIMPALCLNYAIFHFTFKEGTSFPVKLKKGEVFLMGDNRPEARDSREFGPVQAKETLGELMTVIRSEKA